MYLVLKPSAVYCLRDNWIFIESFFFSHFTKQRKTTEENKEQRNFWKGHHEFLVAVMNFKYESLSIYKEKTVFSLSSVIVWKNLLVQVMRKCYLIRSVWIYVDCDTTRENRTGNVDLIICMGETCETKLISWTFWFAWSSRIIQLCTLLKL
jgi:hypothetical protein